MSEILGIHHVTAIASDPQRNVDFYTGVLGLRLVKLTVNYDDPSSYHLYYGDERGTPGSILTFFPWPGAHRGQQGVGQVAVVSFSVLPTAIAFWLERFVRLGVEHSAPAKRGTEGDEERFVAFRDSDGTMLEIVGHAAAEGRQPWSGAPGISRDEAIRGFHGVTLWVDDISPTQRTLVDTLGFRAVREVETTRRYAVGDGGPGSLVDVRGIGGFLGAAEGAGTVHHVAWEVDSDERELDVRQRVVASGLHPTPVIDRTYFHSVYFREPGGVLYELATKEPGFGVDEPFEHLGERLMLPARYESRREAIERALPPIHLPGSMPARSAFEQQ